MQCLPLSFFFVQTCLRESDNSNEEDSLSTHSEDRLSEGSWDRVEPKDTEVSNLFRVSSSSICLFYFPLSSPSLLWLGAPLITKHCFHGDVLVCVCVCVGHEVGARPHGLPLFQL